MRERILQEEKAGKRVSIMGDNPGEKKHERETRERCVRERKSVGEKANKIIQDGK